MKYDFERKEIINNNSISMRPPLNDVERVDLNVQFDEIYMTELYGPDWYNVILEKDPEARRIVDELDEIFHPEKKRGQVEKPDGL